MYAVDSSPCSGSVHATSLPQAPELQPEPGAARAPGPGLEAIDDAPGGEVSDASTPLDPEKRLQPLSLRRNFSWSFAGNAVYAGCQWGMLMVMAKLGSPEVVGQFALGLAVTGPITM